ncbi:hypothetical protein [Actinopolymorpha alba]|uniref:hypothetical protein n=1 Tax=Actinopolymorpha alba TaxID=533267 RepID=UPI000374D951|nr:hypothetical protein [Actinopolymorpha alba]
MLVGSVGLEVVVRPDIDLEIYTDAPAVRDGFAVVSAMAELPHVRGIRYKDARDQAEQGLYWKLVYELTPDQTWGIDMWMFDRSGSMPSAAPRVAAIRAALTEDARDTILAIKEEATARGERANGHWLYRGVLNEGITTYADYLAWLGDQDVWARVDWEPVRK